MSIRFQWSSLVSTLSVLRWMMIRSPSKFRLHEFVYFSAGIAIAGRWHRWVDEISHRFTNFAKVDDGFVLARIWTTTVWSGLWIIFLEWWLSRIGIGNRQSRNSNFDLSTSTRPKIPTFSVGFTDFSPGANGGNCWYHGTLLKCN